MKRFIGLLFVLFPIAANAQTAPSCFLGMNIAVPAVGLYSHAQIYNPAGSGMDLQISKIVAAVVVQSQTPPGTVAADLPVQNAPFATLNTGNIKSKNVGSSSASVAQMNTGQLAAGAGNGVTGVPPLQEFWLPATEKDEAYSFDPPIVVPPGYGIAVRAAQPDMTAIGSWQWCEVTHQ